MKTKIAIIGLGFVGGAIYNSLAHKGELLLERTIIDPQKGYDNSYDDIKNYDAVFICVPSPSMKDGSCDTSILESVLNKLKSVDFQGTIISKVTAPPGVYDKLQESHKNLVHAPEFLTAANADLDYINSKFAVIGTKLNIYRYEAERIIGMTQPNIESIIHCSIAEASLIKYTINSFLATKVIFMNEMQHLANNLGCDWDLIKFAVSKDGRVGSTHMQVPGPDGKYGFGGYCFPKDTRAIIKHAEDMGSSLSVLDAAVKKNLMIRLTDRD